MQTAIDDSLSSLVRNSKDQNTGNDPKDTCIIAQHAILKVDPVAKL